jgi:ATP-dependent RNA helicase DeaD
MNEPADDSLSNAEPETNPPAEAELLGWDETDDATTASAIIPPTPERPPEVVFDPDDAAVKVPYADFGLIRPLADALAHAGYQFTTPVQAAVIPKALRGKDVIGQAQTGTGKTAAFLVPFLNRWRPHNYRGPIGLVMCPTRELALQVSREAEKLAPSRRFRTVAVYGGARMGQQVEGLRAGCDLVVGTPGRIIDHLRRGTLSLDHVRYAVLDEADRMLDIGFRPDIERILRRCPVERQTLLMSATVPEDIKRLVHRYMRSPVHLNLSPKVLTVDKIRQTYITVDEEKKLDLLKLVIAREQPRQCLIFVERKRSADRLFRQLKGTVPSISVIHGDLPQKHRERITAGFRSAKLQYLIATDVMSRGIDVSGISHVINFDLPNDIENYVHRIGRTGRIGRDGVAISFVTPEQGGHLTDIEMTINRVIDADRIEGFDSHEQRAAAGPPPTEQHAANPIADNRDDDGWGLEDDTPKPTANDKPGVFGKSRRRYSNRL